MSLSTDAIGKNGVFDPRYTCDIDNSSPELRWENAPAEATGFALIVEDRNTPTGTFTHWLIYDIPSSVHHLPAGIPPQEALPNGIRQGINSLGKLGYTGPCPPIGANPHNYFFLLFALNGSPQLPYRIKREDFIQAIQPFIIAQAELIGTYQRLIQRAG
jgi:Raf kinase inhibitor-like YbhB/YbcL family protein